jgi:hypothetical protein
MLYWHVQYLEVINISTTVSTAKPKVVFYSSHPWQNVLIPLFTCYLQKYRGNLIRLMTVPIPTVPSVCTISAGTGADFVVLFLPDIIKPLCLFNKRLPINKQNISMTSKMYDIRIKC